MARFFLFWQMESLAQSIIADVERLAEPLLSAEKMTLIDVEYRKERTGWTLRVFIDKEGGVTLQDCADISNQLGDILEAKMDFQGPYHIEVSSPGLGRSLTKPKHFSHFQGRQAVIKTSHPVEGKRCFKAILNGFSEGAVQLQVEDRTVGIPYDTIMEARLDY